MSDQSKFKDEEIREHLRQTQSRRQNIDQERRRITQEIVALAQRGEVEELERKLGELGLELSPERKRIILQRAHDVRQNALRSR